MNKKPIPLVTLKQYPPTSRWKWISKFESNENLVLQHPRHARWMKDHQQSHPGREIMLCFSGSHFYGFRGKVWKIVPGTVMLINKGDLHDAIYSSFQPDCRDLWIHLFDSSFFSTNDITIAGGKKKKKDNQRFYFVNAHCKPFAETVNLAWNHCEKNPSDRFCLMQLKAAVTSLLLEVILHNDKLSHSPKWVGQQTTVVEEIKNYVYNHVGEKLSLSMLAGIAGYDPAYFHRLFAKLAGEPLHKFINRQRLEKAKEMLKSGLKIMSIAETLGFASDSYFCRFFKRETQETPTTWLEKNAPGREGRKKEVDPGLSS